MPARDRADQSKRDVFGRIQRVLELKAMRVDRQIVAAAFVARGCVGSKPETADEAFQVREDEPTPRIGAGLHRTA
jgi:hypothetical protein